MTISFESIEQALYDCITLVGSNANVIFHYPNAPRPAFPYTSIQPLSMEEEFNDWTQLDDADQSAWYGYRETTFTINCYGDNAYNEAMRLQGRLRTQESRDKLRENISASFLRFTTPTVATDQVDDEFERRSLFDVVLLVNTEDGSTTEDTGYFDKVDEITWTNRPPE